MHDNLPQASHLSKGHCVPCEGGVDPLTRDQFKPYLEIVKDWSVINGDKAIQREFVFKDFKEAMIFLNKVGEIAEKEGHHPDMNLHGWKYLTITLSTHAINGLSINDFVLASKIDLIS